MIDLLCLVWLSSLYLYIQIQIQCIQYNYIKRGYGKNFQVDDVIQEPALITTCH